MMLTDMFGNQIEIGTAIADRAVSMTINEPKFGNEVLIRMSPQQVEELIAKLKEIVEEIS